MNAASHRRLAAVTGLVLAAVVALWWLGGSRLALERGNDASRSAADALHALALLRALLLALLGPRLGVLRGWRDGAFDALLMLAPAWPVLVLAGSASLVSPWHLAGIELALAAAAALLPLLGHGLRRVLKRAELADAAAATVGAVLAAGVWLLRGLLAAVPG